MWLLRSLGAFAVAMVMHSLLCRLPLKQNIVTKFLLAGTMAGLVLIRVEAMMDKTSLAAWAAVLLYAFTCELYIFIFASIQTSVSLSLLVVLNGKRMTQEEIDQRLNSAWMIRMRLDGLVREGFLKEREASQYVLTQKGKKSARLFRFFQDFFGHSKSPLLAPRSSKNVV